MISKDETAVSTLVAVSIVSATVKLSRSVLDDRAGLVHATM